MSNRETVLITGASSGIGRRTAIDLSEEYDVILNGRDDSRLAETLRECKPGNHRVWAYDLSVVNTLQLDFEKWHLENEIYVSHFVHCAGIVMVTASRMMTMSHINTIFDINFNSAMLLTASLLKKRLSAQTLKSIIFVSALYSKYGNPGHTIYAASKGALDSAMCSLSLELAPKIRVNTVCPGAVSTPMAKEALQNQEIRTKLLPQYPLGIGEPQDISNLIIFLLSDKARWITGQQLFIDGGRSINMSFK